MLFKTHIPGYPLNTFVRDFFYFEGFTPGHSLDRFLPDGNNEIVIDLTDTPKYIYDNNTLKEIQSCHNVWVSGVRTEPITIPAGNDHKMLVISFKKGRSYPFLPLPADEITDCVVDADLIYGSAIIDLREQLLAVSDFPLKFQLVEEFLLNVGRAQLNIDTAGVCMDYAVNQLVKDPGVMTMQALSSKIGFSQKHFVSLFKKHIGLTPKKYARILRFQKVIESLENPKPQEWSQIALEAGYYDQAHFINDFRTFSGFSPIQYVDHKNDQLNYVPIG